MAWKPNDQLQGGNYTIEKELGQGGFAVTYLAKNATGKLVVIKTLNDEVQSRLDFEKFQDNFLQEAQILAKCTHPNIVGIESLFLEGKLWCMVMEYIDGEDLGKRIRDRGPIGEDEALLYIQQIGEALQVVHSKGLVHRDVKPENIMVRSGTSSAVLIDFGIAREFTPNQIQSHTVFLSEGYSPIEQYNSQDKRGDYTDIYALAATLYVLLTASLPPAAELRDREFKKTRKDPLLPPKQLNENISDRVNLAILKGMALKPSSRPQSVQLWLAMLQPDTATSNTNLTINLEPNSSHPPRVISNHQGELATIIWTFALVLILGIFGGVYWKILRPISPNSLRFKLAPFYGIGQPVILTNTRVCDDNGVADLEQVRFWLKEEKEASWHELDRQATPVKLNENCASFSYEIKPEKLPKPGYYQLRAVAYDRGNLQTDSTQRFKINAPPKDLSFNTDKSIYDLGENVTLIDTKVCDDNGIDDIDRIEFSTIRNNQPPKSRPNLNFKASDPKQTCNSFDYQINSNSLAAGNYQLTAIAKDNSGQSTTFTKEFKINAPPRNLRFSFDKDRYNPNEAVNLINTKVCDDNGYEDINKIFFYLKRDDNQPEILTNIVNSFQSENGDKRCASFTYSLGNFPSTGTYELEAIAEDKQGKTSRRFKTTFRVKEESSFPGSL